MRDGSGAHLLGCKIVRSPAMPSLEKHGIDAGRGAPVAMQTKNYIRSTSYGVGSAGLDAWVAAEAVLAAYRRLHVCSGLRTGRRTGLGGSAAGKA